MALNAIAHYPMSLIPANTHLSLRERQNAAASAMGVVLLVITLGILWLVSRLTRSAKLGEAR